MRPLTERERVLAGVGVAAAVLIPLYAFVFAPTLRTLDAAGRQVQVKTRELASVEAVANRLPATERQRAEIDAQLRAMEQQIPERIQISAVVGRLSRAIDASGVQLIEVTFPAGTQPSPDPADPVEVLPFTLKIRGTFTTMIALMQQLEAPPRLMVGQALTISGGGAAAPGAPVGGGPPLLDITMSMKAFALR